VPNLEYGKILIVVVIGLVTLDSNTGWPKHHPLPLVSMPMHRNGVHKDYAKFM
jgi:hypothetical protein